LRNSLTVWRITPYCHRAGDARTHSNRAGDERQNVGKRCYTGECGEIEIARDGIHRSGSRHARLRVRRRRPSLESGGHRFPRRIFPAPARSIDRVKLVVTAGPTREPIDPVRFLSNRSSGKMGYAIASAAIEANHEVVLISGPVNLAPPAGAKLVNVITSDEMHAAVHEAVRDCDVLVMSAAVSDYKPAGVAKTKIKKRDENFCLDLIPARDILKSLPRSRNFFVVGFAAETNDVEEHARAKLAIKNCDMMV